MIMNPNLFNAILAKDSCNRGYGAGINVAEAYIRNVAIDLNSTTALGNGVDVAIGFYAQSYQLKDSNGNVVETIIAFRGTDD